MKIFPKEKVLKCDIKRRKGQLYFIDKDGDVCEVEMKKGREINQPKTPPIKIYKSGIKKESGYLYFLDRNGDIGRVHGMKGGSTKEDRKIRKKRKKEILANSRARNIEEGNYIE